MDSNLSRRENNINAILKVRYSSIILVFLFFLGTAANLVAMPACPNPIFITQPDGTRFEALIKGDEYFNWTQTKDGYPVVENQATKYWEYAKSDSVSGLTASGKVVGRDSPSGIEKATPASLSKSLPAKSIGSSQIFRSTIQQRTTRAASGTQKLLAIRVNFANRALTTTEAEWQSAFFGASGSVKAYYTEVSYGQFTFSPAAETSGTDNNGIVMVTLTSDHPNTGENNGDANAQLTKDAIEAADEFVDFSSFDSNGDGQITNDELHIMVIAAGFERASTSQSPSVWAHRWHIPDSIGAPNVDGVDVGGSYGGYTQVGELHSSGRATIGGLVHELGHNLGLPDLYDTRDDATSEGVGHWDVMATGNWLGGVSGDTPSHMSAWSKWYMGWVTPTQITNNPTTGVSFPRVEDSGAADRGIKQILDNSDTPGEDGSSEYFLVENRQQTGFDHHLPGTGLLIWHIDNSAGTIYANDVNDNPAHKRVDLEEADGLAQLDSSTNRGDTGDPYPGSTTKRTFNRASTPASTLYDGSYESIAVVKNISNSAATMTANIGGKPAAPTGFSGIATSHTSIRWSWNTVPDATYYEIYDASNDSLVGTVSGQATSSWEETGLDVNTQYSRYVKAGNADDVSDNSNTAAKYTWAYPPDALDAVSENSSKINLSWDDSGATKYKVMYNTSGLGGPWNLLTTINSPSVSYSHAGLTPGGIYYYKLVPVNGDNIANVSFDFPKASARTYPAGINNLFLSALTSTSIRWSWDAAAGADGYKLYDDADTEIASLPSSQRTYDETALSVNTNCVRYVRAFNTYNDETQEGDKSPNVGIYTLAETPSDTQIAAVTLNSISLEWSAGDDPEWTVWGIERSVSDSGPFTVRKNFASGWTETNFTDTGLNSNATYYYRVRAFNGNGTTTGYDGTISGKTDPAPPSPPTGLAGVAVFNSEINWTWNDTSGGANQEDYYSIRSADDNSEIETLPANTTYWQQAGLYVNTQSLIYVAAVNVTAEAASSTVGVYTFADAPSSSEIVSVSSITVSFNWSAEGNPEWTVYGIERSSDNFGTSIVLKNFAAGYTAIEYNDTGLSPDTTYYYRVKAFNGDGIPTGYDIVPPAKTDPAAPHSPSNFIGTALSNSEIMWSWDDTNGPGYREDGFIVKRAADGDELITLDADTTFWIQNGIDVNTQETVLVTAFNVSGISSSPILGVYTLANPPLTTEILEDLISSSTIGIQWDLNGNPEWTRWGILRSTDNFLTGLEVKNFASNCTEMPFIDSGLNSDTSYYYKIRAFNGDGLPTVYDVPVDTRTFKSPVVPPSGLSGVALSTTSIKWSWTDTNSGSNQEDGYIVKNADGDSTLAELLPDSTFWIQTELESDTGVSIYIEAFNASTAVVSAVATKYSLANAPSESTISDTKYNQITIEWSADNQDWTRYGIVRSMDNFASFVTVKDFSDNLAALSYTDTGLVSETTYFYKVKAYNGDGIPTAEDIIVSTRTLPPPPPAPSIFTGIALSTDSIRWEWGSSSSETVSYSVYNSTVPSDPLETVNAGDPLVFTEIDLLSNTRYERYVDAANDHGASNSQKISIYTLANPPERITAEQASTSTINLSWPDSGASKYKIMCSTSGYFSEPVSVAATVDFPELSYKHTGLKAGTTYFYWIYPINGDGIINTAAVFPKVSTATVSVEFNVKFEVRQDVPTSVTFNLPIGVVTINIEAGTFDGAVVLTVKNADIPGSDRSTIKLSGLCLDISAGGQQPKKEIKVTIVYKDTDIEGLEELKLAMGRYDPAHTRWIIMPSTVYPAANRIVFWINHLSIFALLQKIPSADLGSVKVYPNPFNPGINTNGVIIENLTALAEVKIYTIAGRLIKELSDADGDGRINWNGKTEFGEEAASGVYIAYIKGEGTKKVKIAVQR